MINQENLQSYIKWANITGIFTVVVGALTAISIVGVLPGVLMIIAGLKLLNAKKAANELVGIEDPAIFNERLNNMINESAGFFKFQGIYYIASLILGVIAIIVYIALIAVFINNMPLY